MSHRYVLTLVGLTLIALGIMEQGWVLLPAIWLGGDFVVVGVAHALGEHRIFGKRADGSLPLWSWILFLPWLVLTNVVWRGISRLCGEAAQNAVTPELIVGRRLLQHELKGEFENYVDLTSEFAEPRAIRQSLVYRCFPILDGGAPEPEALREFIAGLAPGRTFVHCAQGHGRTGLFALAWMLQTGRVKTVDEGLEKLRAVRPGIGLSAAQRRCIEGFASSLKNRS